MDVELVLLEELNCCVCGIRFGLAQKLLEQRRRDHQSFWCPNGHSQCFQAPAKPRDEELEDAQAEVARLTVELRETKDELARAVAWADQVASSRRPLFRLPRRRRR